MTGTRLRRANARKSLRNAVTRATRFLVPPRPLLESLETRTLLAAGDPIISEFMADNTLGLSDGNGTKSDWIEIHNPSDAPVNLAGWHLTDDPNIPTLFTFPNFTIPAGGYRILFASSKGAQPYTDSAGYIHTNFSLNKGGEYLALVKPDGTATSAFAPEYPEQAANVSYGFGPGGGGSSVVLLNNNQPGKLFAPTNNTLGNTWTTPGFGDAAWTPITTGVGFEAGATSTPPLPVEIENNSGVAQANDASANFQALSGGNLYQLSLSAAIGAAGDNDYFNLGTFQAGDIVTITLSGSAASRGSLLDPGLDMFRAGSPSLPVATDADSGPGGDASIYRFTVTANDTYYVRATGANGETGTYQLGVTLENAGAAPAVNGNTTAETEGNNSIAAANNLAASWRAAQYRSRTTGDLSNDYFKFQFTQGDRVSIFLDAAGATHGRIWVYAADGTTVLAQEDGTTANLGDLKDSHVLGFVAPTTGTYYVRHAPVAGSGGPFTLDTYLSTSTAPPRARSFPAGTYTTDVQQQVYTKNASAYLRVPFSVASPANLSSLTLKMKYDDGFVAYINGTEVARRNAPGAAGSAPAYNAAATADRAAGQAAVFEDIDISAFRHLLTPGSNNVLAIHALNNAASDPEFLLVPQITAQVASGNGVKQYFYTPTPAAPNVAGAGVVINEIHYDPDLKIERVEYLELLNNSGSPVNISNWTFSSGITYTFGNNVTLNPGQYLILAQDAAQFQNKFGSAAFGQYVGSLSNEGEEVTLETSTGDLVDSVDYGAGFPWPTVGDPVNPANPTPGTGGSIQLINPALDNNLGGHWRSAAPTPGAQNGVFSTNAAPAVRQVDHGPTQPVANQPVTITAKVTDPDGISAVNLQYQINAAGAYIPYQLVNNSNFSVSLNPAYNAGWVTLPMYDDGTRGDATAGDGVYSAQVPPSVHQNRTLVRYRVTATDSIGASITAPYADDPQRNFAYFVYNGVPGWSGSSRPGVNPTQNFSAEDMNRLPVYFLLAAKQDVANAQKVPTNGVSPQNGGYGGEEYPWGGTFVYNGKVYDNIRFRSRGGVWRYAMGKNMWKFDFNRNNEFEPHNDYGQKYPIKWSKLNFSSIIQQGDFGHRGEQGLFESVGFKLFNLAGVAAPQTHYTQFRVVDDASEAGATQYDGDLWGMYLAVEQPDGDFLDNHGMPDGNLYKMEGGTGELNNQGPTQPTDKSDLNQFQSDINQFQSEQWWRDNLNLDNVYSYQAIVQGVHHYDIADGKNYYWFHNPDTNRWETVAWDMDLTWADNMYRSGLNGGDEPFKSRVIGQPVFNLEYKNRLRELQDLLFNAEQVGYLIDQQVELVDPTGVANSPVDYDRAMWDYNPIMVSNSVNPSKSGHGRYYEAVPSRTFRGMAQKMKDYVVYRNTQVLNGQAADPNIPTRPTVTYLGTASKPVDGLTFRSSNFNSASSSFAAMEWRIAETYDPTNPTYSPTADRPYEITANWESGELTSFNSDVTIPAAGLKTGHTYRVRVRMKDADGRWSHWSQPHQFIAGQAAAPVVTDLRVTEVMYNPAPAPAGSTYDSDDYEYLEVTNRGASPLDLTGVKFTQGIDYQFPDGYTLAPGGRALIVKNLAAFQSRYGNAHDSIIAGTWGLKNLSNTSDSLRLEGPAGQLIQDFSYSDTWYTQTDGDGYSLVIIDANAPVSTWNQKESWRPSTAVGGEPGQTAPGVPANAVVVNEILANPAAANQSWIELRNTTAAAIDVSHWFLSDSAADLKRFQIPAGTILPAGGVLVFNEQGGYGAGASPFSLTAVGGRVYLSQGDAQGNLLGYRETQQYGASDAGVSIGRHVKSTGKQDFVAMAAPTPGAPNAAPKIGPVIITEVMYNPGPGATEYVEFRNTTDAPLDISNWTLDGVTYTFPTGTVIPARGYFLVVAIDPATFRSTYNVPAGTQVFGPFAGLLDDAGEPVTIRKSSPGSGVDGVPVDHVTYEAGAPWPLSPAIVRKSQTAYANDVVNWAAGVTNGSPGKPNLPGTVAGNFQWGLAIPKLSLTFTEDVSATLSAGALAIQNRSGGAVPATTYEWDAETLTATWTFASTPADANFRATLTAAGIADFGGNALDGDGNGAAGGNYVHDFFYRAGDVNHDRTVDFNDLVALAQSYDQTGKTWANGDFTGDGAVDFNDLVILAQRYDTTLAPPPAAGALVAASPAPAPAPSASFSTDWAAALAGATAPPKPSPTPPVIAPQSPNPNPKPPVPAPRPPVVAPPKATKKPEPVTAPAVVAKPATVKPTFSKARIR
jgi:hypothetical protein